MNIRSLKLYILLVLCAWLVVSAGCAAPPVPPTVAPTPLPPTSVPPTPASAAVTVTDSAGRTTTFATVPQRIISLAPSTTEIVCALGACDKLVGVDTFSDFPASVKTLPRISDGFNPNYEAIVAAQPDLVLAAGITAPDVISKLDELKLPVLVVGSETASFDNVMQDIALVGKVLRADDQAQAVIKGMQDKIAAIRAKVATAATKPRVFWELDATDPAKPFAPGPGSFINELIALAGGTNITADLKSPYAQVNAEQIVQANPEIIILSDAAYGVSPESVAQRPGWNVIAAVRDNKVFPIDDNLVSRPGPRLAEGLEAAAKLIHPELFGE